MLLQKVAAYFVLIAILVVVHELGHFLVARWAGVKVLRFSVGFGRVLWSKHDGLGTEWAISLIPFGGYVKMLDKSDAGGDTTGSFDAASPAWKLAIAAAGPLANFVLAIVFYTINFMVGVSTLKPVLAEPAPNTPAAQAGLHAHDEVLSVAGVAIRTYDEFALAVLSAPRDAPLLLEFRHNGATSQVSLPISQSTKIEDEALIPTLGLLPFFGTPTLEIDFIKPGSPAALAQMKVGDKITAINGKTINQWSEVTAAVNALPVHPIAITITRAGVAHEFSLTPEFITDNGKFQQLRIGVGPKINRAGIEANQMTLRYGLVDAVEQATLKTKNFIVIMCKTLARMVVGQSTLQQLSGPLSMADYAGRAAAMGLSAFVDFLAAVSISLGVFNLLPIPLLDGGHLLYHSFELISGKPLSERVLANLQKIGIAFVLGLMAIAFLNDFLRYFLR